MTGFWAAWETHCQTRPHHGDPTKSAAVLNADGLRVNVRRHRLKGLNIYSQDAKGLGSPSVAGYESPQSAREAFDALDYDDELTTEHLSGVKAHI